MGYPGAGGKLIHEQNQKQKISWHCPFKAISYGGREGSSQQAQQSVAGQFIGVNLYTYNERRRSVRSSQKIAYSHMQTSARADICHYIGRGQGGSGGQMADPCRRYRIRGATL